MTQIHASVIDKCHTSRALKVLRASESLDLWVKTPNTTVLRQKQGCVGRHSAQQPERAGFLTCKFPEGKAASFLSSDSSPEGLRTWHFHDYAKIICRTEWNHINWFFFLSAHTALQLEAKWQSERQQGSHHPVWDLGQLFGLYLIHLCVVMRVGTGRSLRPVITQQGGR